MRIKSQINEVIRVLRENFWDKEDLEQYKGRPSRGETKKKGRRASKKTRAAKKRSERSEANAANVEAISGTLPQRRFK